MNVQEARERIANMPAAQMAVLLQLSAEYPEGSWHFNECDCCVCFHADDDTSSGWVIGSDGGTTEMRNGVPVI